MRVSFLLASIVSLAGLARAQYFEGWEPGPTPVGVAPIPAAWTSVNNSAGGPGTNPNWQVRNDGQVFPAYTGTTYAFANYNSATGANNISNYLISPLFTFNNGDSISFYTRTVTSPVYPDSLDLVYNTTGSILPADFTNILVQVNPGLTTTGYPNTWTLFTATISGLSGPTPGRFAFHYNPTNGGPAGNNSDYIGVDEVIYVPAGGGTLATNTSYGAGCYARSATWYELFGTFDLANTSILLVPNGSGYTMIPGTPTAFVHTVPGLALTDDSIGTLALPSAFNYPGGSTTSLSICSNGYIWTQPNALADYSPTAAELFTNPARYCPLWCDLLPDGATNVNNVFAQVDTVNNKAYVTWVNVPTYALGGTVNMQLEFDLTSGTVNYTFGAVTLPSIVALTGWTPGSGFSTVNLGSMDVSASLPSFSTFSPETLPLALSASATPVIGRTITYTTSNVPATGISAQLISLIQVNPGIGLPGAPGCLQLVDLPTAVTILMFGSPTATFNFTVPNNAMFAGLPLFLQSASIDPTANLLGIITSDGIRSLIGTF